MRSKVVVVTPDSSKQLKNRIYRLRYRVYVEELGHKLENYERMLHDKYDEYSTSFLLEINGEDIGTIRYTTKMYGALEIEGQQGIWRRFIDSSEKNADTVCEVNGTMVRRDHRATFCGPFSRIVSKLAHSEHTAPKRGVV